MCVCERGNFNEDVCVYDVERVMWTEGMRGNGYLHHATKTKHHERLKTPPFGICYSMHMPYICTVFGIIPLPYPRGGEPCREPPEIPLATNVWSRAQHDQHVELVGDFQVAWQI